MHIHCEDLPKYIDISAVRTDCTYQEVLEVARIAKKYKFMTASDILSNITRVRTGKRT